MNDDSEITIRCKYHIDNKCLGNFNDFDCSKKYYILCERPMKVTWSYYLINKKHLIEVKDE